MKKRKRPFNGRMQYRSFDDDGRVPVGEERVLRPKGAPPPEMVTELFTRIGNYRVRAITFGKCVWLEKIKKEPKKPTSFCVYYNYGLSRHYTGNNCAPRLIKKNEYGDLWMCHHEHSADFIGYPKLKDARSEEIATAKTRITMEKFWIEKLERGKA